ncbi:NEDD4-binding protein 2-like 1 [Armadillidium nasatum]|uniref:NEDD4-binding protein 2-like 1 n=1 Tax=Armadillidium nasatum TaxID=96803 RepID=A0A5N5ST02_9CRUS|nr:NEDD4-binding protein 2-like 1 [Armadillidium nasatum]
MSDHGNILTYFESIFGQTIDHEVIKIILQSCDWDTNVAYEQLLSLTDNQVESSEEKISEPDPPLASSLVKRNGKPSNTNFTSHTDVPEASHSEPPLKKKKVLIIMRGLPGSGKSTLAHSLNTNGVVLSTDDYFIDKFQNYNFNSSILPEAHKWNKDRAKLKLYNGVTPIFIDNTNLQLWEFEPYIRYALENGYYVDILEPDTYWKYNCKILSQKCVHKVPNKKIAEMKGRYETNLSIEDFLKKLKLSNNLNGIDINTYRSVSRNSDSEIVVEDDSSSDNGSNNENESPRRMPNSDILSHNVYSDSEKQNKNNIKETVEKKNEQRNEREKNSLMSDIESSMERLSLSKSPYRKEHKEYSAGELPDSQNFGDMGEWDFVTSSSSSSTWTDLPLVKTSQYDASSSAKPQRFKKSNSPNLNIRNSNFKNSLVDKEYDDDCSDNDDDNDKDDIEWSPVEDLSCLTWENKTDPSKLSKGIPKFQEEKNCSSKSSLQPQASALKIHSYSHDCDVDFSSSDTLKTIQSHSSNFIPNLNTDAKEDICNSENLSDKGTIANDSCKTSKKNAKSCPLHKLKSFFPDIAEGDLEDFLEKCDYDVDWTMNILIDSGYKISSNLSRTNSNSSNVSAIEDEPPCSPVTQGSNESIITDESNSESNDKDESSKNDDDLCSASNPSLCTDDDENDSGKEGAQYLTMEMDSQFAAQLINMYGPISSLNIASGFTKEDCRIVLPLELCHDIYKYWAKTLEGKFSYEKDILDMFIREDEELARKLQEEEEENAVGGIPATNEEVEPISFKEIVNMQSLEENKLRSKSSKESVTYSSMLSLQKLQEEFPHVDPTAVEEEYFAQNLDYSSTKTLLTYKYGAGKSASETGAVASSEEPSEDWEDFGITVDDPQMYRDEAQLHYLERKKALQKAQEASQKGMKSVASYYAQIGNLHMQKFKEANERASKKILSAFNSKRGPNSLDLHLLHVDEALREAQRFLKERKNVLTHMNLKEMSVSIITGKGNHSLKGEARLKPAIKTFLSIEGYRFTEYGGCFKIVLRSQSSK